MLATQPYQESGWVQDSKSQFATSSFSSHQQQLTQWEILAWLSKASQPGQHYVLGGVRHMDTYGSFDLSHERCHSKLQTVVNAFISSWLDYCNSLLFGISDSLLRHLQAIQNTAACLVTGTRQSEQITTILRQLHWLPVWQHIELKLTFLVYKELNGLQYQNASLPLPADADD